MISKGATHHLGMEEPENKSPNQKWEENNTTPPKKYQSISENPKQTVGDIRDV